MPHKPASLDPVRNCFYSQWFTVPEKRILRKNSLDGCDEVWNLRTFAGRLTAHLSQKSPQDYDDSDLKLLTTLVRISVGIGALLRGDATLLGKDSRVERAIEQAIENLGEDWSQA